MEEKLNSVEFYTLLLWAEGCSQSQIAAKLFRSAKFVENIFRNIKRKLKTKNAQHSLQEAWKRNLFTKKNCVMPSPEQLLKCMMLMQDQKKN